MTPSEKLHAHHEKLIGRIRSLAERSRGNPVDVSLLLSYCNEYLLPHADAEEVTLYKADDDASFVEKMVDEHKELKSALDSIGSAYKRGEMPMLKSMIDNFTMLLDKHFDEEEKTLMPRLTGKITQQELETIIADAHRIEAEGKKANVWSLFELDHQRIDLNITGLKRAAGNLEEARHYYSHVRAQLLKHIELEETVLFPGFEERASNAQSGPVRVMIAEHREIVSLISSSADAIDVASLSSNVDALIAKLAVHNKKEELILYPLINRSLPRDVRGKMFAECFEGFAAV